MKLIHIYSRATQEFQADDAEGVVRSFCLLYKVCIASESEDEVEERATWISA